MSEPKSENFQDKPAVFSEDQYHLQVAEGIGISGMPLLYLGQNLLVILDKSGSPTLVELDIDQQERYKDSILFDKDATNSIKPELLELINNITIIDEKDTKPFYLHAGKRKNPLSQWKVVIPGKDESIASIVSLSDFLQTTSNQFAYSSDSSKAVVVLPGKDKNSKILKVFFSVEKGETPESLNGEGTVPGKKVFRAEIISLLDAVVSSVSERNRDERWRFLRILAYNRKVFNLFTDIIIIEDKFKNHKKKLKRRPKWFKKALNTSEEFSTTEKELKDFRKRKAARMTLGRLIDTAKENDKWGLGDNALNTLESYLKYIISQVSLDGSLKELPEVYKLELDSLLNLAEFIGESLVSEDQQKLIIINKRLKIIAPKGSSNFLDSGEFQSLIKEKKRLEKLLNTESIAPNEESSFISNSEKEEEEIERLLKLLEDIKREIYVLSSPTTEFEKTQVSILKKQQRDTEKQLSL